MSELAESKRSKTEAENNLSVATESTSIRKMLGCVERTSLFTTIPDKTGTRISLGQKQMKCSLGQDKYSYYFCCVALWPNGHDSGAPGGATCTLCNCKISIVNIHTWLRF